MNGFGTRLGRRIVAALGAISIASLGVLAAVAPGSPPGNGNWPPSPDRLRYPAPIPTVWSSAETSLTIHPGVRDFLRRNAAWKASVDPLTGSVERAFGDGVAEGGNEAAHTPDGAARRFLAKNAGLFAAGVDLSEAALRFNADGSSELPDPEARFVRLDLWQHGLPVLDAGVTLAIRGERVFYVSAETMAPVATSPSPSLSPSESVRWVEEYAGVPEGTLREVREPSLAYAPVVEGDGITQRVAHRLVWMLELKPEGARSWEGWFARVDAHDGTIVAFYPEARNFDSCQPVPAQARGLAIGGVRANRADDPEVARPLPFVRVKTGGVLLTADLNGRYPYFGDGAASPLEGQNFRMRCDACTNPAEPAATPDESGVLDFGLGGTSQPVPVSGNGFSTPADRTSYFHLTETYRLLQKWNQAKFSEIESFVNIDSTCNAFSSGYMLGFFRAGGNCNDTGEIRDVVGHELGHTWDRSDGNGITSGGMSEWKGDTLAMLLGGDGCIGESFRLTGGPTSVCSGVRDIDEKSPGRVAHPPGACPTCPTLTRTSNDCGGAVHCTGEISGQALWHLYNNLRTGTDYITGAPMPGANPAFTQEQARWLLERLYIGGGAVMSTWDPTAAGTSEYDAILIADDNDGNLANGTPHAEYINAAYLHHELNEATLIGDSANCIDPTDPTVVASVERDPATGLPRVRLQWTPTDGSTLFDVYRNQRAGDAFLPIAQNVGLAGSPVFDTGVLTGATYRYFVAAVKKVSCAGVSPGNNIQTVTVNLPDVQIATRTIVEAPGGADGDGLIEPGERVRITLNLKEAGGSAAAAGVAASLTSANPNFAPVVTGGPIAYGTIPAGGTVNGPSAFEVQLSPSLACGALVHQVASVTGSDGCWLDSVDIELAKAPTGCTATAAAFVEVVPGSPAVISGNGDADGTADNCEVTTVSYQLRNAGSLSASGATGLASSGSPGVTFGPYPLCSYASIPAGQTRPCQFSFSLGGASNAGVPFTLTANSAANLAPAAHSFTLPAESNTPTFGTTVFNFDGSGQGWTVSNFAFALNRSVSSPRSLRAGDTTVNNLCARATSPPLLLSPSLPSTMTLQAWIDIEPLTDLWYDRANVHLIDLVSNEHTLLTPTAGLPYNASGNEDGGLCHVPGENGWAGSFPVFNSVTFDLSPWQGRRIQIELNYNSDEGDDREGIYFDDITLTNVTSATLPSDAQSNSCTVPEVSGPSAPVRLTVDEAASSGVDCSWQDFGLGYQYNVYAGNLGSFYGHGASALTCQGSGTSVSCDGSSCSFVTPGSTLPAGNLYFLVTATAFGIEGTSGFATPGERDPLQNSCSP